MTNDEILQWCVGLDINILSAQRRGEPLRPVLEDYTRTVLSKAYEESLSECKNVGHTKKEDCDDKCDDGCWATIFIAGRIRQLQSSLCDHGWIDARNEVVQSGEYCSKCGTLRPSPPS